MPTRIRHQLRRSSSGGSSVDDWTDRSSRWRGDERCLRGDQLFVGL